MSKTKINRIRTDDFSKDDPFSIKNFILGDLTAERPIITYGEPIILEGVSFVMCIKGKANIRIDLKEYELSENTILTIFPERIVDVISGSDDLVLEILFFSFDFISDMHIPTDHDLPKLMSKYPLLKVSKEDMQDLLEFHTFIAKQYNRKDTTYLRINIIKGLLYALLSRIGIIYLSMREDEKRDLSSHQEELLQRFLTLLREHHKEHQKVSFYADKMCLTSKYLSTTIKKLTGKSILAWVNFAAIMEAKILLRTTNLTVTQISENLNFPNSSFFGRLFKKHTGLTPLEYRNG